MKVKADFLAPHEMNPLSKIISTFHIQDNPLDLAKKVRLAS